MAAASPPDDSLPPAAVYTLHVFPFSLQCIYVRFASVLGAIAHGPLSDAPVLSSRIELRLVNVHREEHLREDFLKLNPKGQVPVLTGPGLSAPLTEGLEIATWVCQLYPKLLPSAHAAAIIHIISQLYSFDILSLITLPHDRKPVTRNRAEEIRDVLKRGNICHSHRRALDCKLNWDESRLKLALAAEMAERARVKAREFLTLVFAQRRLFGGGSLWLYGDAVGPTVLDAYAHPFITHLLECRMDDLVPPELRQWVGPVGLTVEWDMVMHGRMTLWSPIDDGPVENFPYW